MYVDALKRINENLSSWEESLLDPQGSQEALLQRLLVGYRKTGYGLKHKADSTSTMVDYRNNFPVATYLDLEPWLDRVKTGDWRAFLYEEPRTWVMTRGTTGRSKVLPATDRHLSDLFKCGSRAVLNFAMGEGGLQMLSGGVLNLQFPSNTESMQVGDEEVVYGFSSGTYAKLNPMMMGLSLVPRQEEIDVLQTDLRRSGWEKRYEFIYERAKDEDVVSVMGVAPVQTGFARHIMKHHRVYPKNLWDIQVVYSTSVAKIQSRYRPKLQRMYGDVPVVEMYTATEGAFGQQKDHLPYFVPNYDTYLFEVNMGGRFKMIHDMARGEWGRLVVSTSMLPRYDIGDLIEAMGKNYFRVFGRASLRTVLEHVAYRALYGWFI